MIVAEERFYHWVFHGVAGTRLNRGHYRMRYHVYIFKVFRLRKQGWLLSQGLQSRGVHIGL